MIAPSFILAAALGAFFEVHTIPLERSLVENKPATAKTFFAKADNDATVDLFILQGNTLTAYSSTGGLRESALPTGVTAFDVADVDGDGQYEIIAVNGASVIRIPLALQGETAEPTRLFDADSFYAQAIPEPDPTVLVVPVADTGQLAVALPTAEGEQLRALDGTVVETRAYARSRIRFFVVGTESDEHSLTLPIYSHSTFDVHPDSGAGEPVSPKPLDDVYSFGGLGRAGNARSLREAVGDKPSNWPWFAVLRDKDKVTRAYCAVEESLNTLIRMCDVATALGDNPKRFADPGPQRRYPGAMVPIVKEAPDFNGDGNSDLLLWNAPRPGISVDALLRAVVGRDWPISLTVHLYAPDKGRFEPQAATELKYRIPVTWFLTGLVPLRHCVLADFNGDKKTDLAMCTAENEYSVWLYSDGFAAAPDEKHTFTENITGVELTGDVAGNGKTSVVLRSDHYVYALYAK